MNLKSITMVGGQSGENLLNKFPNVNDVNNDSYSQYRHFKKGEKHTGIVTSIVSGDGQLDEQVMIR